MILGVIRFLTAMSSAIVYGLLPRVSGSSSRCHHRPIGCEGAAEGMMSLARIASGLASDLIGRRKPLVLLGCGSAFNKVVFPLAGVVSVALVVGYVVGASCGHGPVGDERRQFSIGFLA